GDAGVEEAVHEHDQFWGDRRLSEEAAEALSVIIKEMNERHGEDLTQEHMITLDQYTGRFSAEPQVVEAAKANDDFEAFRKIAFSPVFLDTIISQMNTNEEVFKLILSDERMREAFERYVAQTVYDTARSG
ncbi:MAG TPA: hypothetical protein VMO52_03220, partial [Acidimicrobiia bacterium]|nr:hypothetical protein [Acidimicrobiia bacterium]